MLQEAKKTENDFFLGQLDDLFLPTDLNFIFSDPHRENLIEFHQRQPVKFITKQEIVPVQIPQFLQKKTLKTQNPPEKSKSNDGRWTKDEQHRFAEAVYLYGNDWKKIQEHVNSRNITQVRSHAQKFLMKLKENRSLLDRGLGQGLSWTKTIIYLQKILPSPELKEVLFSVEQSCHKKSSGHSKVLKGLRKLKPLVKEEDEEEIREEKIFEGGRGEIRMRKMSFAYDRYGTFLNLGDDSNCFHKNNKKKFAKPEEEQELMQKLIKCFNGNPAENITLNSSFDETCSIDGDNNKFIGFNPLNNKNNMIFEHLEGL